MYIRRVVLENLRGFRELDFTLERPDGSHAGWTVVTGDNGAGKTALLKAIAVALVGPPAARVLQTGFDGWIRTGYQTATVGVELVADQRDKFQAGRRYERPFWSELELAASADNGTTPRPGSKFRRKDLGPTHGPWTDHPNGWFAAGYGPFRRLTGHSSEAQRIMAQAGPVGRFATLFREDATLREADEWLHDLNYRRLEHRPTETAVLQRVVDLLNADFLRHGLSVDRIDADGLWLRQANGALLPLRDMSEGYRAALAMLVDLLRSLVGVYGPEAILGQVGHGTVDLPGVVLIDEVDAHLHPEWQRQVGFWLKSKLPQIQFIVTTHSPAICQAADPNGLFHLPAPDDDRAPFALADGDYQRVIAGTADAILLSPAFGQQHTRSPLAVDNRRRYSALAAKRRAVPLTQPEEHEFQQLALFVDPEEA
ncbi:MAG: AAA family ATPase [Fimbriimonadaceae bacterium]|nr:AAA family ATPase [Fimbriimonadaceae bacterium]